MEGKELIKPFNEMYNMYSQDYNKLEREYERKKEEEEKNRHKGSSNKFIHHLTTLQKEMLRIDRQLLEESTKNVRGMGKFVDPSSKLMVRKERKDIVEVKDEY